MNEKKKALLQKLKALAERGMGGEKEGAERKLKQLMAKYGVDQLEFEEDQVARYEIKYRGEFEHRLLSQIIYRVRNDKEGQFFRRHGKGSKSILIAECTKAQEIQIRIEFEFYRDLLKEEQELLFEAFIQKHRIFGDSSGEEPEIQTPEEMERLERMWAMMAGLQEKSFTPLLENRNGRCKGICRALWNAVTQ